MCENKNYAKSKCSQNKKKSKKQELAIENLKNK